MAIGSHSALAAATGGLIALATPVTPLVGTVSTAGSLAPAAATQTARDRASAAGDQIKPAETAPTYSATSWMTNWKPVFEIIQSVVTTLALLAGGIWAYAKVLRGRLYRARLEPSIDGRILSGEGFQCAVLRIAVKNVCLSRVNIDKRKSTIEVKSYTALNYMPEFHNAFAKQLGVVEAIIGHDWIEPGECITEERLFALPAERMLALVVQFRLLDAPRFRPSRAVEWNSIAVVTPEMQPNGVAAANAVSPQ